MPHVCVCVCVKNLVPATDNLAEDEIEADTQTHTYTHTHTTGHSKATRRRTKKFGTGLCVWIKFITNINCCSIYLVSVIYCLLQFHITLFNCKFIYPQVSLYVLYITRYRLYCRCLVCINSVVYFNLFRFL